MIGLLIKKSYFQKSEKPVEISSKTTTVNEARRDWMEIYLRDSKVGYSMIQINPMGDDYLIWEEIVLNLNLMGQASVMRTTIRSVVDHGFRLKRFTLQIDSGVVRFQVSGKVEGLRMHIETGQGTRKKTRTIALTAPPVTGTGISQFFRGRPLKAGESFNFLMFDPSTLARKSVVVTVVGKESIVIKRIKYHTFRLETEMWGQELIFWVDEAGEVLKETGFMGFTLIRSSAAAAPRDLTGETSDDFYEMASIDVTPKLRHADRLTYLKMRVEGLENAHFDAGALVSERQRLVGDTLEIIQEKRPLKAGYMLPLPDVTDELNPYLSPGFNIQSDDTAIVDTAREIVGDLRNPVAAARKLMAWVYAHVEKKPVLSVPSAVEVLKTKTGDCNEHAVLLTALLRAAGIPARECVGLVYANDRFFYHAWTEAYIGRWVSMDATLNQMPTDATHIKLVQGGLERQTDIIALIGKLRLKILNYEYDRTD
jgi:transglutaminase-like putative cysteine protease